ncbi:MAG: IS630 family transposase, partial [Candidatus Dormibacteraeota bacterium]|nr:IS630 family transposase [Candidatus Dormibacteraeota bacterium]
MQRGRPHKAFLDVAQDDRSELLRWIKRPKSSNGLAQRARIVLRCADGVASARVAAELGIT